MKHSQMLLTGLGLLTLFYLPLRFLEDRPFICFIVIAGGVSYLLGYILENWDNKKKDE